MAEEHCMGICEYLGVPYIKIGVSTPVNSGGGSISNPTPGILINKTEFMNEVKGVDVMLLKIGSRGAEVEKLQADLTKLGYDTKGTDGIFGNNTKLAVMAFQADNDLERDGIAGDFTLAVIAKSLLPKISLTADIARLNAEIKVLKDKLNQIKKMTEV